MAVRLLAIALLVPLWLAVSAVPLGAAERGVVLIVANGLTLQAIADPDYRNLNRMAEEGGAALMNTRAASRSGPPGAYLTIGAGTRALAQSAGSMYAAGESVGTRSAAEAYAALTGREPPREGLVLLGIEALVRGNVSGQFAAQPGLLGSLLADAGHSVRLLGSADAGDFRHREAALIAMDEQGRVPRSDISLLRADPTAPSGTRTDYERLWGALARELGTGGLTVVETGDSARLNSSSGLLASDRFPVELRRTLTDLDLLVGRVLDRADPRDTLVLLVSPSAPTWRESRHHELTPLLAWGRGVQGTSLLTSGSTRNLGIVTNTDVAPTILETLGVSEPFLMTGRPIVSQPSRDTLALLQRKEQRVYATEQARRPLLTAVVTVTVALLLLALLQVVFALSERLSLALRFGLLWMLSIPLALLLIGPVGPPSLWVYGLAAVAVGSVLALMAYLIFRGRPLPALLGIGAATTGLLIVDLFAGLGLTTSSVLGHSPVIGARFYGLGNEYMGVLLGATIVASGAAVQMVGLNRWSLVVLIGALGLITATVASPQLGANVGGTIAVVSAFGYFVFRLAGIRIGVKQIGVLAALVILAVGGLLAVDLVSQSQSHAAKALLSVEEGGISQAALIIQRKLSMNLKLIRFSVWSQVLIASLIVFAVLLARPPAFFAELRREHNHLITALGALVVGTIVAFVFNDSGVVTAATSISFGIGALLYLLLLAQRPGDGAQWEGFSEEGG